MTCSHKTIPFVSIPFVSFLEQINEFSLFQGQPAEINFQQRRLLTDKSSSLQLCFVFQKKISIFLFKFVFNSLLLTEFLCMKVFKNTFSVKDHSNQSTQKSSNVFLTTKEKVQFSFNYCNIWKEEKILFFAYFSCRHTKSHQIVINYKLVIDEDLFTLFFSFPKCGQNHDKEKTKKDGISDY